MVVVMVEPPLSPAFASFIFLRLPSRDNHLKVVSQSNFCSFALLLSSSRSFLSVLNSPSFSFCNGKKRWTISNLTW